MRSNKALFTTKAAYPWTSIDRFIQISLNIKQTKSLPGFASSTQIFKLTTQPIAWNTAYYRCSAFMVLNGPVYPRVNSTQTKSRPEFASWTHVFDIITQKEALRLRSLPLSESTEGEHWADELKIWFGFWFWFGFMDKHLWLKNWAIRMKHRRSQQRREKESVYGPQLSRLPEGEGTRSHLEYTPLDHRTGCCSIRLCTMMEPGETGELVNITLI